MTFLPFRCPTFRTSHLLEPCTKNLARVKYLQLAKKHIGPLELCVECKGKMLETAPLPNKSLEEGRLSTEEEAMVIHPAIFKSPEYASPEQKGWEPHPEVTTAPLFLKDVPVAAESRLLSPYPFIPLEMKPLSPEKIAAGRAAGHNLGKKYKTKKVLDGFLGEAPRLSPEKEDIYHRIIAKQEEVVPELPQKASDIVQVKPEVLEQRVLEGKVERPDLVVAPPGARYCPTHPKVMQRIDKLGRWMGMCDECLSDRGRECGSKNFERGITAPPVSIPLNLPRYAEIKAWLAEQADLNERTLQKEIMMILKMAWRQGI